MTDKKPTLIIEKWDRYTQGIMNDGPVILQDGNPLTPENIVAELNKLTDVLAFYGDPESYLAIGFFPDPPCGEFVNDWSNTDYGQRPGMMARKTLGIEK